MGKVSEEGIPVESSHRARLKEGRIEMKQDVG
jgi:hypothetical protein